MKFSEYEIGNSLRNLARKKNWKIDPEPEAFDYLIVTDTINYLVNIKTIPPEISSLSYYTASRPEADSNSLSKPYQIVLITQGTASPLATEYSRANEIKVCNLDKAKKREDIDKEIERCLT